MAKNWKRGHAAPWIRRAFGLAVIRRSDGCATVTRAGVESFADRWPCAGFPDAPVTFVWDGGPDGDLLDIVGRGWDGDGPDGEAVSAMFDDVRDYCSGANGGN